MFDLCERDRPASWSAAAALEKLIKAGALDCLHGHRAQLMAVLPRAIQAATERQNDLRLGQSNLFEALRRRRRRRQRRQAEALPDVPRLAGDARS